MGSTNVEVVGGVEVEGAEVAVSPDRDLVLSPV